MVLSGVRPIERPMKKPPASWATAATMATIRMLTPWAGMSRMSAAKAPSTPTQTTPTMVTPRLAVGRTLPPTPSRYQSTPTTKVRKMMSGKAASPFQ